MKESEIFKELMSGWNKVERAAREQFPNATDEKIFEITSNAMNLAFKIKQPTNRNPRPSAG